MFFAYSDLAIDSAQTIDTPLQSSRQCGKFGASYDVPIVPVVMYNPKMTCAYCVSESRPSSSKTESYTVCHSVNIQRRTKNDTDLEWPWPLLSNDISFWYLNFWVVFIKI